jgi:site-specific DNA-methyltransferase (adenine-specific)
MPAKIPYPGGKARLAKQIVSFLPRDGHIYLEPFAGRGNLFWAAIESGLKYKRWWLNDIATAPFLDAIRTHGHTIKVPPRSREEFEKQRDAFKRGDPTAILLAPHLAYSGGLYESGVKGGSGCGDDDGGVTSTGFEKTLKECHRILHRTKAKITSLDWTRLPLNTLSDDDVVVIDAPYPHAQVKAYSDATVDYETLVDVLLKAKFRWVFCGYPHPLLHRLGAPIWARDMQLLCVRIKAGQEERNECVWANFKPEMSKTHRILPPSVIRQIKAISNASSLSFRALNEKIDDGLALVARDWNALIPYLLEMQRRLSAPGKRTDLRKGAPTGLTWTVWVETKKSILGRSLRSVQRLLRGRTQASLEWHRTTPCREVLSSEIVASKIHCGDCVTLMEKMPDSSVDLIVTSPPYNLRNSTGNGMKYPSFGCMWESAKLIDGYESGDDAMPYGEYVKWQRKCLTAMMRLLRDDGAIFYNHKWRVQDGLLQDRSEIVKGFPVRQIIIWHRNGGLNFNDGYFLPSYECLFLICKPKFKLAHGANAIGDVWRIPQETNNPHPAPFPVELARRCIESTTAGVVLDPFIGSGTTAVAAELCGRSWIGMEISQDYCKMANERIKAARKLNGSGLLAERAVAEPTSIM